MDKKHFSHLGFAFCFATLMITLVQYWAGIILNVLDDSIPAFAENVDLRLYTVMLPVYFIAYPLIYLVFKKIPAAPATEKKKMSAGQLLIAALMCYSGVYICNYIGSFMTFIISLVKQDAVTNNIVEISGSISLLANFIIMVIFAPITEELLFRKALMDRTAKYGEGISIALSGLLFCLFHGNLNQAAYTIFMGCFFGFVYIKTRNVKYTIILHMISNFIGTILANIIMRISKFNEITEQIMTAATEAEIMSIMTENMGGLVLFFGYAFCLFGFVIAGIVLFIVKRKKFTLNAGEITIAKGQRFKTVIFNLGMGIFCFYWIAQIIYQLVQ